MPCVFDVARDEIQGAFWTQWQTGTPAVNGGDVPPVFWEGLGYVGNEPEDVPWATAFIRHTQASQRTLADQVGKRRFLKLGTITVQIFVPVGGGLGKAEELSKVAKKAFEGKSTASAVWFRNVKIVEVGIEDPWYQVNVLADFEYDELA
jgi:hypothetical protein